MIVPKGKIVNATEDDVARFYGPIEFTGKWVARALRKGPLVAGFGGLIETEEGVWFAFLEVPMHERKPSVYRHILEALTAARRQGAKVFKATCDTSIPGAEKLMIRLGFKQTEDEINGKAVWEWQV